MHKAQKFPVIGLTKAEKIDKRTEHELLKELLKLWQLNGDKQKRKIMDLIKRNRFGRICEITFDAERFPKFEEHEERIPDELKHVCMDEDKAYQKEN